MQTLAAPSKTVSHIILLLHTPLSHWRRANVPFTHVLDALTCTVFLPPQNTEADLSKSVSLGRVPRIVVPRGRRGRANADGIVVFGRTASLNSTRHRPPGTFRVSLRTTRTSVVDRSKSDGQRAIRRTSKAAVSRYRNLGGYHVTINDNFDAISSPSCRCRYLPFFLNPVDVSINQRIYFTYA